MSTWERFLRNAASLIFDVFMMIFAMFYHFRSAEPFDLCQSEGFLHGETRASEAI